MLTMADEGGKEGLDPPVLTDIFREQPRTHSFDIQQLGLLVL